jgi:hypothetical protein
MCSIPAFPEECIEALTPLAALVEYLRLHPAAGDFNGILDAETFNISRIR